MTAKEEREVCAKVRDGAMLGLLAGYFGVCEVVKMSLFTSANLFDFWLFFFFL